MSIARTVTLAAMSATLFATGASADMKFATGRQGGSQYPVSVACRRSWKRCRASAL